MQRESPLSKAESLIKRMGCCANREGHQPSGPACADGLFGLASLATFCSGTEPSRTLVFPPLSHEPECNSKHGAWEQGLAHSAAEQEASLVHSRAKKGQSLWQSPVKEEQSAAHSPVKATSPSRYPYPFPYSATSTPQKDVHLQTPTRNLFASGSTEQIDPGAKRLAKLSCSQSSATESIDSLSQDQEHSSRQLSHAQKRHAETLGLPDAEIAYGKTRAALRRVDRPDKSAKDMVLPTRLTARRTS